MFLPKIIIIIKGQEEKLGSNDYVYGLDGDNGFEVVYIPQNSQSHIH